METIPVKIYSECSMYKIFYFYSISIGMSNLQGHQLERIQMYKNRGCSKIKPSHVQVYKYNKSGLRSSSINDKYLFDRSHQPRGKASEIHTFSLKNRNVAVRRVHLTTDEVTRQSLDNHWEPIGSIKESKLRLI